MVDSNYSSISSCDWCTDAFLVLNSEPSGTANAAGAVGDDVAGVIDADAAGSEGFGALRVVMLAAVGASIIGVTLRFRKSGKSAHEKNLA